MILKKSKIELEKCKKGLTAMQNHRSFEEYEENWRNFLTNLETVWIKSERECFGIKNFQPWQGQYKNERRIDPLLKYVKNARDVETHSIQEIVEKRPLGITLNPIDKSKPLFINNLTINNGVIHVGDSNQPIVIESHSKIVAIPIVNHGVTYLPPDFHRGEPLKDKSNPVEIARLAIIYYENYLNEIERKF